MTNLTKPELMKRIEADAKAWYELGCEHFKIQPSQEFHVIFKKRGRVGGTAWFCEMELDFNLELAFLNQDEYFNQVIPHEVAHIVAQQVFGNVRGRGHGIGFYHVLGDVFGARKERCHNMDTSAISKSRRNYVYNCKCGEIFKVTKNMHTKLQNGSTHYCRKCHTYFKDMKWALV